MPKFGDPIRLNLQIDDGNNAVFVQAFLQDAAGTAIGSPVPMTNYGNGLYKNSANTMPNMPQVTAVYVVYTDAGHTTPSTIYADGLDVFNLEQPVSMVPELYGEIVECS